jgi:hypothetical protein
MKKRIEASDGMPAHRGKPAVDRIDFRFDNATHKAVHCAKIFTAVSKQIKSTQLLHELVGLTVRRLITRRRDRARTVEAGDTLMEAQHAREPQAGSAPDRGNVEHVQTRFTRQAR